MSPMISLPSRAENSMVQNVGWIDTEKHGTCYDATACLVPAHPCIIVRVCDTLHVQGAQYPLIKEYSCILGTLVPFRGNSLIKGTYWALCMGKAFFVGLGHYCRLPSLERDNGK